MKKMLLSMAIAGLLFSAPLKADEPVYTDWLIVNGIWIYVGAGDPEDPQLPPAIK